MNYSVGALLGICTEHELYYGNEQKRTEGAETGAVTGTDPLTMEIKDASAQFEIDLFVFVE